MFNGNPIFVDGRVTRSRLRAMQANNASSNNQSVSQTAKSFFVQGKDKIAKKGRSFLKKTDTKKNKESMGDNDETNFVCFFALYLEQFCTTIFRLPLLLYG